MCKFTIGQQVKVNTNNFVDNEHFNLYADAVRMDGTITVITAVRETKYGPRYEIAGSDRAWHEDCLEDYFEEVPDEVPTSLVCVLCGKPKRLSDLVVRNGVHECIECIEELAVHIERRI